MQCLVFLLIMYWFAGFQSTGEHFVIFFLSLYMFQLMSESLGMLAALVTKQATFAIILLTFVLLLVLSFSGFLVSTVSSKVTSVLYVL